MNDVVKASRWRRSDDHQASTSHPFSLHLLQSSMWHRHYTMQSVRSIPSRGVSRENSCSAFARQCHIQMSQLHAWTVNVKD